MSFIFYYEELPAIIYYWMVSKMRSPSNPFLETLFLNTDYFPICCCPQPDFGKCLICLFFFFSSKQCSEEVAVVGRALSLNVLGWLISVASAPQTALVHSAFKAVVISILARRANGPVALGCNQKLERKWLFQPCAGAGGASGSKSDCPAARFLSVHCEQWPLTFLLRGS